MTSIDERIFQKPIEQVSTNDLNLIIGKTESLEVEFKQLDDRIKGKDQRKEKIIKPLVSFLNSTRGSGLLILGIKEDNETANEILGVNPKVLNQLKTENALETFIYASINSIPSEIDKYVLKVRLVPFKNDKNVYIIKIERKDSNCVYSSEITGRVYVREGRKSNGLNLNKALDLISKKNYSQPYMQIVLRDEIYDENGPNLSIFDFMLNNMGIKPAERIMSIMVICSNEKLEIIQNPRYSFNIDNINLEKYELGGTKEFKHLKVYNEIYESRHPLYPFQTIGNGILSIKQENINFKVFTLIFESNGFTKQEFFIQTFADKKPSIVENKEKRLFKPYIIL